MAKALTLHEGEALDKADPLAGQQWTVLPGGHVGHVMTVLGRVAGTSMFAIQCECGEFYRMAYPTVRNGLDGIKAVA